MVEVLKERKKVLLTQLEEIYCQNFGSGNDISDIASDIQQSIVRIDILLDFMRPKEIRFCEGCGALSLTSGFYTVCETCWDTRPNLLSGF